MLELSRINQRCYRILLAGIVCAGLQAQETPKSAKPDNTRANANPGVTADQQKETKADRDLAQRIRKAVMADKSLSTYAHNAKIIAINGTVTLRGPVRNDQEKSALEAKAKGIAGVTSVSNELTIAPK